MSQEESKVETENTEKVNEEKSKKRVSKTPDLFDSQIEPYGMKFVKFLGKGSSGLVVEAVHKSGERVAIKVISKEELKENMNLQKKVEREIAIMKLVSHKNLIRFRGVAQDNENVYLVMELAEGGELFKIIQSKKLSDDEIFHYFSQVVEAMSYLHDKLICHRDLKSENILLDKNGVIKVSDFGLATLLGDKRLAKTSCGSPHYASPEVILATGEFSYNGISADMWSLGVLLYTLATNQLPFYSEDVRNVLDKVVSCKFRYPKKINLLVKDLISHLIKKNPNERFNMDQLRGHEWYKSHLEKENSERKTLNIGKAIENAKIEKKLDTRKEDRYLITDDEINSESGKKIIELMIKMGWKGREYLIRQLKDKNKNFESVVYILLENRILNNDRDTLIVNENINLGNASTIEKKVKEEKKKFHQSKIKTKTSKKFGKFVKNLFGIKSNKKYGSILTELPLTKAITILKESLKEIKLWYEKISEDVIQIQCSENVHFKIIMVDNKKKGTIEFEFELLKGDEYTSKVFFDSIKKTYEEKVRKLQ